MKKNHTLPPVPEAFHQRVQHTLEGLPEQTRSQRRFPLRGVAGVALAAALCLGALLWPPGSAGLPLFFPQGRMPPCRITSPPRRGGHRRERPLPHDRGRFPL